MNILVVGCGKLGRRLVEDLYHHGHSVSVIDKDEDALKALSDEFEGITVVGTAMDIEVLKSAGIESCDAVATATADDNLNITVSQIAREFFGVKNVVTRIIDPAREKVFNNFGLRTMCETKLSCRAIFSALIEETEEKQITFDACTMSFFLRDVESILVGRTISCIPTRLGETVLGILDKSGHITLNNGKDDAVLNSSDKIIYAKLID